MIYEPPPLPEIASLQKAMSTAKPALEQATDWYTRAQVIESHLELHPHTGKHERELIDRVKAGISATIASLREGHPSPPIHNARVALSALRDSIERRTTGPDGYPLRR